MSGSLLLIASYPKSGNTWTRLVFEHFLRRDEREISINGLSAAFHGGGRRQMFDIYMPVSSSELTFDEIENLLPTAFRALAAESDRENVVKIHECSHRNTHGEWIFPPECVCSAIYLVRHPFDVAVSYANHMGQSPSVAIDVMGRRGTPGERQPIGLELPLPQLMGSWSENVGSWIDRSPYRTAVARYEDLHATPEKEFQRLAEAAKLNVDSELVAKAVAASRFDLLQEQEREKGFRERPESSPVFFRAGRPKTWEGILDSELRQRIVREHGQIMQRLGYLEDGSIAPTPDLLRR